jgi:hypothetical protein
LAANNPKPAVVSECAYCDGLVILLPFAALAAIVEIMLRRAGTVYMEARHV